MATLGNHDFNRGSSGYDGALGCPSGFTYRDQTYGGLQLNRDKNGQRPAGTENFWLPDYNYHYEIPAVQLEVISVDQNYRGLKEQKAYLKGACDDHLAKVQDSGEALLQYRGKTTNATSVLIIQHYPWGIATGVMDKFKSGGSSAKVISAYGHDHWNSIENRGNDVLVRSGGGGGHNAGQDPNNMHVGFVAVHLDNHGGFWTENKVVHCRWG